MNGLRERKSNVAMAQTAISFQVDGVDVDGVVGQPSSGEAPYPGVVVCHPHPLFGGNMDSSVVLAICRALAESGIASLRFNFRAADNPDALNAAAAHDAAAALRLLDAWEMVNSHRLAVAGYSFGAAAMARAVDDLGSARALALVAPPVAAVRSSRLGEDDRPLYILVGGGDRLVDPEDLSEVVSSMRHPATFEMLEGADHMFAAYESAVGDRVAEFLSRELLAGP